MGRVVKHTLTCRQFSTSAVCLYICVVLPCAVLWRLICYLLLSLNCWHASSCRLPLRHCKSVTTRNHAELFVIMLCLSPFINTRYQTDCFIIMLSLSPFVNTRYQADCFIIKLCLSPFVTTRYQADCFINKFVTICHCTLPG